MALMLGPSMQCAAVASRNDQAIAKSAERNSSKIHLIVDAHGNPLKFFQISDGVTHDVKIAPELLKKSRVEMGSLSNADKGYDS